MTMTADASRLWGDLSTRDRRAVAIVAIFLVGVVGYTQLIEPLVIRFESALERRDRSEQASAGYIQKIRMLPRREARLSELKREKAAADAYFTADSAARVAPAEALIDELTTYARISGAVIRQLVPEVETFPDVTGRVHDLELSGEFPSLRRFLYLLETSPRKFRITQLEVNPPKEGVLRARVRFFDSATLAVDTGATSLGKAEQLTIGVYGTADDLPIHAAHASGGFSSAGVAVRLIPAGSPDISLRRLLSGELDAVAGSLYDVLRYQLGGAPVRVLVPLGRLPLDATLLTVEGSGVTGAQGLAGRTVGVEPHGMTEPLLLQLLAQNGMDRKDVRWIYLNRRALIRHLKSGLIEAAVLSNLSGHRIESFGLKVLEKLTPTSSHWQSYLLVHADALDRQQGQWVALARLLFETSTVLMKGNSEGQQLARGWLDQQGVAALTDTLAKISFPDAAQALQLLSDENEDLGLGTLQQLLLELGEDVPDVARSDIVDSTVLDSVLRGERYAD